MIKIAALDLVRPEIRVMKPYMSARALSPVQEDDVLLDANEMPDPPFAGAIGYNRYAEQQPEEMVRAVASFFGVDSGRMLVSRGGDEAIDVLVRLFCAPGKDSILVMPPAFPMYARAAQLNGNSVIEVPLGEDFKMDVDAVCAKVAADTKLVFVCTPNNPVGVSVPERDIATLCERLQGRCVVVVDEAYVEFSPRPSVTFLMESYDNLVVLRTLSKAMALAGVRCGGMIAREELIAEARKVLAVYPVPVPVMETVLKALSPENRARMAEKRREILETKESFVKKLETLERVEKIYPSDANFVLVRFKDGAAFDSVARKNGFIMRYQGQVAGMENCFRISIGTPEQMRALAILVETGTSPEHGEGRTGLCVRRTNETSVEVRVNLDTPEPVYIRTGIGFFDHMLEQIAAHAAFSLRIEAAGDVFVDPHHTVEDTAIALGQALRQALGSKVGIERYGFTVPMDESIASIALDLSGRGMLVFKGNFADIRVGELPTSLVEHFFRSLAENLQATIHVSVEGRDAHHQVESCFKALGRVLRRAASRSGHCAVPSTKGAL